MMRRKIEEVRAQLIFPSDSSQAVKLFAEGGSVQVNELSIHQMRSAWDRTDASGQ
jgi:hypothetical protein